MNHMNLALKYRPKFFNEVVGQPAAVKVLRSLAFRRKDLRVVTLAGQFGIGKTTLSRLYAKAINCENPSSEEPCGTCLSCQAMDEGRHSDYTEKDMGQAGLVEHVRKLREDMTLFPTWKARVFTLDEIHGASREAFNALLKVLEEPPPHASVVMCTTNLAQVPFPIVSRSVVLQLQPMEPFLVADRLLEVAKKEGIELDRECALMIGRNCSGSMRDSFMMLDVLSITGNGKITKETMEGESWFVSDKNINEFVRSVAKRDREAFQKVMSQLTSRLSYETLVREGLRRLCQIYVAKDRPNDNLTTALWKGYVRLKRGAEPELTMEGIWIDSK